MNNVNFHIDSIGNISRLSFITKSTQTHLKVDNLSEILGQLDSTLPTKTVIKITKNVFQNVDEGINFTVRAYFENFLLEKKCVNLTIFCIIELRVIFIEPN